MTRRDFILISETLKESRPPDPRKDRVWRNWRDTCERMANALVGTNPNFDRARFLNACGLES
jgi:hypothetical protein